MYCFQLEKKPLVYAKRDCASIGSKLFEPKSLASNTFVTQEAKKKGMSQFWIGIHDARTEDSFRYFSNNKEITWINWRYDQPNNNEGGEDCVSVGVTRYSWSNGGGESSIYGNDVGKWWDQKCTFLKAFVCESLS